MIVLGIDPGTAATGYGIVERTGSKLRMVDYGCFETLSTDNLPHRLLLIHQAVSGLIAEHRPELVGVERLFFNRNVQTAFAVGQARGAVLLAAAEAGGAFGSGHGGNRLDTHAVEDYRGARPVVVDHRA
jgi:crossover junction endodeoxyribonuclease RuvC